jgi:hypothetical protein
LLAGGCSQIQLLFIAWAANSGNIRFWTPDIGHLSVLTETQDANGADVFFR